MCWPASFPVSSTVWRVAGWIGVLEDLLLAWGIFIILGRGSITTLTDVWSSGATHAVADLYRKSGSDGQGHVPLLQTHLAPDPTEGETPTWIIFPVKSINIACNRWHSPFPPSSRLARLSTDTRFELRAVSFHFYFGNNDHIRSLQKHRLHPQQCLRSILPVAPRSRSNPEGVAPFFLSLTSACNLVLLNSKDPTVLLASVQRTSPFIIESLMNDLVRQ